MGELVIGLAALCWGSTVIYFAAHLAVTDEPPRWFVVAWNAVAHPLRLPRYAKGGTTTDVGPSIAEQAVFPVGTIIYPLVIDGHAFACASRGHGEFEDTTTYGTPPDRRRSTCTDCGYERTEEIPRG